MQYLISKEKRIEKYKKFSIFWEKKIKIMRENSEEMSRSTCYI